MLGCARFGECSGGNAAMNWGRGLFRIWMLLTVVWIAVIGWLGFERVAERYHPVGHSQTVVFTPSRFLELRSGDGSSKCSAGDPVRHELPTDGMPEAGPMTLLVFCERDGEPSWANQFTRADELVTAVRELVARHDAQEDRDRLTGFATLTAAMALPFGVLLIVMLLRWIVGGFRRAS